MSQAAPGMPSRSPPFFRPASTNLAGRWQALGLREGGKKLKGTVTFERELLDAWGRLSEYGEVFGADQLFAEVEASAEEPRNFKSFMVNLRRVTARLGHSGIILRERATEMGPGMSKAMIFTLRSPEEVARGWRGGPRDTQDNPEVWRAQRKQQGGDDSPNPAPAGLEKHLEHIEATYRHLQRHGFFSQISASSQNDESWTLHLIGQLLERCSRTSPRERVEQLQATIQLGGEPVDVSVSRIHHAWEKGPEYGVVAADDSQLILAILTYAMQQITTDQAAGRLPQNRLTFDLLDLSNMLAPEGGRSAYQAMQKGMARILNTQFVLNLNPTGQLARRLSAAAGGQPSERIRFQLVENPVEGRDEVPVHEDGWEPSTGMRYFAFSLHPLLWQGLVAGQGLLVHPALLFERSGVVHKIYHHLRLHAGSRHGYRIHAEDLLDILNLGQGSNRRRARIEFCEKLWQQLRERAARSGMLLPAVLEERTALRLYDLELVVEPTDRHKSALVIEAWHSDETIALIKRQEMRTRAMQQRISANDADLASAQLTLLPLTEPEG